MVPNPYHAPRAELGRIHTPRAGISVLLATFLAVLGSTVLGAASGMALGALLGTFVPEYYRSVFANGGRPQFNPVAVGIGQGVTQGAVLGAIVGVLLVGLYYRHRQHVILGSQKGPER